MVLSIPYVGFRSFLQALLIDPGIAMVVSIPYVGSLSFLPTWEKILKKYELCVNTLCRVFIISTVNKIRKEVVFYVCQYPISGLYHFYMKKVIYNGGNERCQYPISGLYHFYSDYINKSSLLSKCQYPISGLLHFY